MDSTHYNPSTQWAHGRGDEEERGGNPVLTRRGVNCRVSSSAVSKSVHSQDCGHGSGCIVATMQRRLELVPLCAHAHKACTCTHAHNRGTTTKIRASLFFHHHPNALRSITIQSCGVLSHANRSRPGLICRRRGLCRWQRSLPMALPWNVVALLFNAAQSTAASNASTNCPAPHGHLNRGAMSTHTRCLWLVLLLH